MQQSRLFIESIYTGAGNVAGAAVDFVAGVGYYVVTDAITINGKSAVSWVKEGIGWIAD